MSKVNEQHLEDEERGWSEVEKVACNECVDEPDLWRLAPGPMTRGRCDYCKVEDTDVLPVGSIQEILWAVIGTYYASPDRSGVPYAEGAYVAQIIDTDDVLHTLGFDPQPALFQDILDADLIETWVQAANGGWAEIHDHQVKLGSWSHFSYMVKHQTRFHFQRVTDEPSHDEIQVADMLRVVGEELEPLIQVVELGTQLYRARHLTQEEFERIDAGMMGAAPEEVTSAGRMNPAGIPYFYGALDQHTAIAEIGPLQAGKRPCVATFVANRPLRVVDLTQLPEEPSMFAIDLKEEREKAMFLGGFVGSITQPVVKNGQEHIDYVPSQVVSEYLAQVFVDKDGQALDGVKFPSTVQPGGINLVIFPSGRWFDHDRFASIDYVEPT